MTWVWRDCCLSIFEWKINSVRTFREKLFISLVVAKQSFPPTFAAMFKKLRNKWKVNGLQLALILTTFAVGGSLTGYAGRKLMHWLTIDDGWFFLPVYIILLTLLWPLLVLLVSIPFGQFSFFVGYLKKMGKRMGLIKTKEQTDWSWTAKNISPFLPPGQVVMPKRLLNILIITLLLL